MKPKRMLCFVFLYFLAPVCFAGDADPKPDPKVDPAPAVPPAPEKKAWRQLKPDRLIADNSLIYISTPDYIRSKNAFNRTAFRALLGEDEVMQPIAGTFSKIKDSYIRGDGTRSELEVRRANDDVALLQKLLPYMDGQVALAL